MSLRALLCERHGGLPPTYRLVRLTLLQDPVQDGPVNLLGPESPEGSCLPLMVNEMSSGKTSAARACGAAAIERAAALADPGAMAAFARFLLPRCPDARAGQHL